MTFQNIFQSSFLENVSAIPAFDMALALILALMLPLVSLAEVSKVVQGGALNMRAEPSLSAQVLRQYPTGTWMTVLEDMGEWSKVLEKAGLKVHYQDERLTTVTAEAVLIDSGVRREDRRRHVDKLAATVILEQWLASEGRRKEE